MIIETLRYRVVCQSGKLAAVWSLLRIGINHKVQNFERMTGFLMASNDCVRDITVQDIIAFEMRDEVEKKRTTIMSWPIENTKMDIFHAALAVEEGVDKLNS